MQPEPYADRKALIAFDRVIEIAITKYKEGVARSSAGMPSDMQAMASALIPQSFSLALSIRSLVQNGFLFAAHVLVRPLVERVCILMYVDKFPAEIEKWKRGWKRGDAPSLSKMFDLLRTPGSSGSDIPGSQMTTDLNSLVHGKPDAARWNLSTKGHSPGLILDSPALCDEVCLQASHFLAVASVLIDKYFPLSEAPAAGDCSTLARSER